MEEGAPDSGSERVVFKCTQGISREMTCEEIILQDPLQEIPGNPVSSYTSRSLEIVYSVFQMQRIVQEWKYLPMVPEHTDKHYVVWVESYMH